jgi:hypothetical protein
MIYGWDGSKLPSFRAEISKVRALIFGERTYGGRICQDEIFVAPIFAAPTFGAPG